MTEWTDRYIVIVPMTRVAAANALAKAWDPDTGGDHTFGAVRLSATSQEPATHTACNTAANVRVRTGVLTGGIAHAPWFSIHDANRATFEQILATEGLRLIEVQTV